MAISRAQLAKELEPGLNSLFGLSYDEYTQEYALRSLLQRTLNGPLKKKC